MIRRTRLAALLSAVFALSALLPASVVGANPTLNAAVVQSGLVIPWDVAFTPGGQMIVTERPGRVKIYVSGSTNAQLLRTTTIPNVWAFGEAGLMGVAVDHLFNSNRLIYLCVTRNAGGTPYNQVLRYKVNANWSLTFNLSLIPKQATLPTTGMAAANIHNGCAVQLGPDRALWVTMGDASNQSLPQNPASLNGKVLRIGRDGSIPASNPTFAPHARSAVYSIGHRNPQGIAFMPGYQSSRAYVIEHGPTVNDEINWIKPGLNYGWPCRTGTSTPGPVNCSGTFTGPRWASGGSTWAVSNGTFVTGSGWKDFAGDLFVATLKESDLRRFEIPTTGSPATYRQMFFNNTWGRLRAVVNGPGGAIFLTTSNGNNDRVIKVSPS